MPDQPGTQRPRRRLGRRSAGAAPDAPGAVAAAGGGGRIPTWPAYPPKQYLGQLDPAFQRRMGEARAWATREDCNWYHAFDLPDGSSIDGAWDLRGNEPAYLGGVDVRGKRVIEPGPASGYLSFYMDRQGAEVVSFETGFDVSIDLLPFHGGDTVENRTDLMRTTIEGVHNSWWYMHRTYGSSAKLVHGDLYNLPGDLGAFDVALFGAILLHLREPWGAISEVARRTRERIIVTDLIQDREAPLDSNIMRFSPLADHEISNWWTIYPGAVVKMLERVGFGKTTITEHTQTHHLGHQMDVSAVEMPMFTVVGERG
jgi:O-methyltransferase